MLFLVENDVELETRRIIIQLPEAKPSFQSVSWLVKTINVSMWWTANSIRILNTFRDRYFCCVILKQLLLEHIRNRQLQYKR